MEPAAAESFYRFFRGENPLNIFYLYIEGEKCKMKIFKRVRPSVCILAAAAAIGVIGCSKDGEAVSAENGVAKKNVTIVLDWTPNTNHTGLFAAKELGYFDEAGIHAEIVQPPEGSTTALIGAGKAEFGISFQDTLAKTFASDAPMPVTAVAAILQHNTSGVISLKKSGIAAPKDMSGKRYSTWDDPIELAILKKIVTDDGGDFESIIKVPYSENIMAQIQDTSVNGSDSGWVYYAWDGIAFNVKKLDTNFINFADYGKELDYYTPVLIASDSYLKNNKEEAAAVVAAIKKGYEYAVSNPKEAADMLLKNAPELDKDLVYASQQWISGQYIADADGFGIIDADRWNGFYKWLFDNRLIEKAIPENYGFSNEYLAR